MHCEARHVGGCGGLDAGSLGRLLVQRSGELFGRCPGGVGPTDAAGRLDRAPRGELGGTNGDEAGGDDAHEDASSRVACRQSPHGRNNPGSDVHRSKCADPRNQSAFAHPGPADDARRGQQANAGRRDQPARRWEHRTHQRVEEENEPDDQLEERIDVEERGPSHYRTRSDDDETMITSVVGFAAASDVGHIVAGVRGRTATTP